MTWWWETRAWREHRWIRWMVWLAWASLVIIAFTWDAW